MRAHLRTAFIVGFVGGLQSAIADMLARHGFAVLPMAAPQHAIHRFSESVPNLVVVTGRCGVPDVVHLIDALPKPRTTRIVVLLPGPDPDAERQYRAAGVRVVLRMPVAVDDLIARLVAPTEATG
jgi:DNA-binding response OmpR family regulator